MSASDRDEVTFLCMKRMAEKCVIIVVGTTLHDGNQSCCARYSSERERGGNRGSHQWCHLAAGLRKWPSSGAQRRRPVVLRWGDGSRREEGRLESGWVRWRMGVLSVPFIGL
jgi:hypothetical protein